MEDFIDITKLNNIHIESYMTKEEFIKMIESLRFTHIKEYDIDLITGFEYNAEENKTNTRGYNIKYY